MAWHGFLAGVPFRFKESGAVAHYLGRAHRKYQNSLQEFDEVLVTYPPEGEVWPDDWFIVRMDANTHEMRTLTYVTSARSQRLFETTCEFGDYVTVEGMKIPTTRTCFVSSPIEASLHTWKMADLRFNQVSPDDMFERKGAGMTPARRSTARPPRREPWSTARRPPPAKRWTAWARRRARRPAP